jgi:wobble nucleotide-excising tRNase
MRIRKRENGEKCIFCGGAISDKRWEALGNYFNDAVKELESRIDDLQADVNGRTVDNLTDTLYQVFVQNGDETHFDLHWGRDGTKNSNF